MALLTVVLVTVTVVVACLALTLALCTDARHVRQTIENLDSRLIAIAPYLVVTAAFFLGKRATHGLTIRISEAIDWDITAAIYAIEGLFVAHVQDLAPELSLPVFSAIYMFGFPYLLVVPLLAYFTLPTQRYLKELLVAYVLNYLVGTLFYTLFIARGPRIHISQHVSGLMYDYYPQTQELTAVVSDNTNVFPSLHTSLAVVVAIMAWRTRHANPRWFPIATVVASGVVLSTMVLGIHWLIDVVAGIVLAVASVIAAIRIVRRVEGAPGPNRSRTSGAVADSASTSTDD